MRINVNRRAAWLLILSVGVLSLSACGYFAPPLASESIEVDIELEPGETQTLEFEFEAEPLTDQESFSVVMNATIDGFARAGITAEQTWSHNGVRKDGWPTRVVVERDKEAVGDAYLTLTNTSDTTFQRQLEVRIRALPYEPEGGPSAKEFRLAIRQK